MINVKVRLGYSKHDEISIVQLQNNLQDPIAAVFTL